MGFSFSQSLEQKQRLEQRMTTRQLLSLHILQKNAQELQQEIQTAIQMNPLLEVTQYSLTTPESEVRTETRLPGDGATPMDYDHQEYLEQEVTRYATEVDGNSYERELGTLSRERLMRDDEPAGEFHNDSEAERRRQYRLDSYSRALSMYQLLMEQVHREIGFDQVYDYIASSVDSNGYLQETPAEIARECEVDEAEVLEKLSNFQEFAEPAGIGARDLRECLLLQLKRRRLEGSIEWELIHDHMDKLAAHSYRQLTVELDVEPDEITDAVRRIQDDLSPAPGQLLSADAAALVFPDVLLFRNRDGEWEASANRALFPALTVSEEYNRYLNDSRTDSETKKYIRTKQNEAQTFIEAVDYRLRTIEKIALAIVRLQPEFFASGRREDLRPLTQNAVASALNYAESTVSRAMQDKFVATPWGTFPFRIFFPSAIHSEGGNAVSSSRIRRRIREIIDAEDKRKPISDEDISARLAEEGYEVKRRTVAKYRDLEKIPSTSQRRQR
ncbi:MAG: RNA polymerase factor sigma-54 [Victivallales bacterium]|nr:RNA polymerase factor sigma-54 [Victivallales bacterium]